MAKKDYKVESKNGVITIKYERADGYLKSFTGKRTERTFYDKDGNPYMRMETKQEFIKHACEVLKIAY